MSKIALSRFRLIASLLFALCGAFYLTHWQPLQPFTLEISPAYPGQMLKVKAFFVDGERLPPTAFQVDFHTWQSEQGNWVASRGGTGSLLWQGYGRKDCFLLLQDEDGGQAVVKLNGQALSKALPLSGDLSWTIPIRSELSPQSGLRQVVSYGGAFVVLFFSSYLVLGGVAACWRRWQRQEKKLSRLAARRWLFLWAALLVGGSSLILLFNYVLDPLQFYRLNRTLPHWSAEQRYQNPGLLRNLPYDRVILGTSAVENYIPEEVDEILGGKSVKLAMSGSSVHEQALTLTAALATGKVQSVLWELDFMSLGGPSDQVEAVTSHFPFYLYDQNFWNDWEYLFNGTTTRQSSDLLLERLRLKAIYGPSLQLLNNWQAKTRDFGQGPVVRSFEKLRADDFHDMPQARRYYEAAPYTFDQFKANIDRNILPFIAANPTTQFDLLLPPSTLYFYELFRQKDPATIDAWLQARIYLCQALKNYPNAIVHDFQAEPKYIGDLSHYKDLLHFDQTLGNELLQDIKLKNHTVFEANIETQNGKIMKWLEGN
ncbi:MAG: hypothetical protein E6713_00905 [Sporomusaceae bacterium]|nr:hypothetical protein [Sporomusaceae bacterium]